MTKASVIREAKITRFELPSPRVIGDSQVRLESLHIGALELDTDNYRGLGFFEAPSSTGVMPPLAQLELQFETEVSASLIGERAEDLLHRSTRPSAASGGAALFGEAIDQALWDLLAKEAELPLYQLLGGTNNAVPAYASGLEFHLEAEEVTSFFAEAQAQGFSSFKVKVGHPDLTWDVARLVAVREIVGPLAVMMADANEAWSAEEAIHRLHAFRDAGIELFWIEDPCGRYDFRGLRQVVSRVPFVHVNSGEYLDLAGKRKLLEHRAVGILNIHGHFSDAMETARLAAQAGVPVSVGNTLCDIGVHVAAALPDVVSLEFSSLGYDRIVQEPVTFEAGLGIPPERPGHGLVLSEAGRSTFSQP
jgi:L-alanine-DL-glutamate epimerase-like enolase superfamily enzyme